MKLNGTFKIILIFVLALAAVLGTFAWALSHYLFTDTHAYKTRAKPTKLVPVTQLVKPEVKAAPLVGQAMLFTVHASVSTDDGPDVKIDVQPSTEPCVEPRWLDSRRIYAIRPMDPLRVKADASWCLIVAPGQRFVKETLPGKWLTFSDKVLDIDATHQYMRVQHASGRWLGVRAIAAGYCASESSACSGTALVDVSLDDRNMLLPVMLSSKNRDVLRLVNGDELTKAMQQSAAVSAARAAAREAAANETPTEKFSIDTVPADAPTQAPSAEIKIAPEPVDNFVR